MQVSAISQNTAWENAKNWYRGAQAQFSNTTLGTSEYKTAHENFIKAKENLENLKKMKKASQALTSIETVGKKEILALPGKVAEATKGKGKVIAVVGLSAATLSAMAGILINKRNKEQAEVDIK